jgi:hypothetical protein
MKPPQFVQYSARMPLFAREKPETHPSKYFLAFCRLIRKKEDNGFSERATTEISCTSRQNLSRI